MAESLPLLKGPLAASPLASHPDHYTRVFAHCQDALVSAAERNQTNSPVCSESLTVTSPTSFPRLLLGNSHVYGPNRAHENVPWT